MSHILLIYQVKILDILTVTNYLHQNIKMHLRLIH